MKLLLAEPHIEELHCILARLRRGIAITTLLLSAAIGAQLWLGPVMFMLTAPFAVVLFIFCMAYQKVNGFLEGWKLRSKM